MGKIGSQAEYAKHAAISRQAVSKAVRAGSIPRRPDGKIDFDLADEIRRGNANPARDVEPELPSAEIEPTASVQEDATYRAHRAERERIGAERAALDLAKLKGELIPRKDVADALVTAGRVIRGNLDALANIADEVVALCANGGGAIEVRQVIAKRVTALETTISNALAKLGGEDDG